MIRFDSTYSFCEVVAKTTVYRSLEQDLETGLSLSLYDPIMRERIALHGFLALGLVLSACAKDDTTPSTGTGEEIRFSAYKNRIVTRSGDGWSPFDAGTKYDLYIIDYAATPDWTEANALLYAGTGTELSNGTIDYGTPANFTGAPLNFYAATYGTETKPVANMPAGSAPAYEVKLDANDRLPDLMRAEVIGRDAAAGSQVELDFTHTLSKIRFEIAKQTSDDPMNDIYIQHIALENMYGEGILNLQSGTYTPGSPTAARIFYDRSAAGDKQYIGLSRAGIKSTDGDTNLEMLIFPRDAASTDVINIKVVLGKDGESDAWKTVDVPVEYVVDAETDPGATAPFEFKPNHEYVLTLMVTDNTVRLLIFETQVYKWIDVDHGEEETQALIGKPVSFAGLLWMDRNLGANSADCYNDWNQSRGYYYQFGRNIPFIVDETFDGSDIFSHVYSVDNNGNRVYGQVVKSQTLKQVAQNPGDIPSPSVGYTGYELSFANLTPPYSWVSSTVPRTYWNSTENQPCPKGWRIPTMYDFVTFIPDPIVSGNVETVTATQLALNNVIGSGKEDRIIGRKNGIVSIYIIKNINTNACYRIRIRRLASIEGSNKTYFEINRYPGQNGDRFTSTMTAQNVDNYFNWDIPSEQLLVPGTGYINQEGIDGNGISTVLRTSNASNQSVRSYVCYFRTNTSSGFGLFNAHNDACASQIRCVRDLNEHIMRLKARFRGLVLNFCKQIL